jgi:hypothetical protein
MREAGTGNGVGVGVDRAVMKLPWLADRAIGGKGKKKEDG